MPCLRKPCCRCVVSTWFLRDWTVSWQIAESGVLLQPPVRVRKWVRGRLRGRWKQMVGSRRRAVLIGVKSQRAALWWIYVLLLLRLQSPQNEEPQVTPSEEGGSFWENLSKVGEKHVWRNERYNPLKTKGTVKNTSVCFSTLILKREASRQKSQVDFSDYRAVH